MSEGSKAPELQGLSARDVAAAHFVAAVEAVAANPCATSGHLRMIGTETIDAIIDAVVERLKQ